MASYRADETPGDPVEAAVAAWRAGLLAPGTGPTGSASVDPARVETAEDALRVELAALADGGPLTADEALLIAARRVVRHHGIGRAFVGDRAVVALVPGDAPSTGSVGGTARSDAPFGRPAGRGGLIEALAWAVGAAVAVQVARRAVGFPEAGGELLGRNAVLLVLPFVAALIGRRRRLAARAWLVTAGGFALTALAANLVPPRAAGAALVLATAHLPLVAWAVVAVAHAGGDPRPRAARLAFVRFTGEWALHLVLLALGGGVLTVLTGALLAPVGVDLDVLAAWVLPSGAAGAAVVATWLVDARRGVGAIAPTLAAVFTPLFAVMTVVVLATYASTGLGAGFDRELVAVVDALLVVVFGLVLFGVAAEDRGAAPGRRGGPGRWSAVTRLVAIIGALGLDLVVLSTMARRVGDLGATPNRVVALGLNVVLAVGLAGGAVAAARTLAGRAPDDALATWLSRYLPVPALWAAAVVVVLPRAFGAG